MEKYIRLFIIGLLLLSCDVTDDELILLEPTLELDGRLPMDGNGYYRLELNDSSNQTIHTISGTVGNTLYWDEPMKVEWESNLYWNFDDNIVSVTNCCSYVTDGEVMNVIAPVQTMVGNTLISVSYTHLTLPTIYSV